jgi:hypothetical protein
MRCENEARIEILPGVSPQAPHGATQYNDRPVGRFDIIHKARTLS